MEMKSFKSPYWPPAPDHPRTIDRRRRTPIGMTVVSPSSSVDSPSTIAQITPTRRMLFEKKPRGLSTSGFHTPMDNSIESRQESQIHELRLSNERKDSQLKLMHERFTHIQQGLGDIDNERSNLVEKSKKLQKEKKLIQKQLELREREILALVKRCASQEEKMRESSQLRARNRDLEDQLKMVQKRVTATQHEEEDLYTLRKKLEESELAREELKEKLRRIQREHDSIADTLQECLSNIRRLTEEKQQIEEERRRERKRAELELEKQRLAHTQAANTLKDDLESKQLKILQMERILQDNMYSKTSLRRENALKNEERQEMISTYEKKIADLKEEFRDAAEKKTRQHEIAILNMKSSCRNKESSEVISKYEQKIVDLKEAFNETVLEKDRKHEQTVSELRKKIQEKEAVMTGLEHEFSGQMGELMKKQSSLDEAEEEKKNLEGKVQQLEKLENEHSALVEYVRILDSNLADLTSENAHIILEKDNLYEEAEKLRRKTKELEFQLNRAFEHRDSRDGNHLTLDEDGMREELETSLARAHQEASSLEAELASRNQWINKLEQELREVRIELLEKEDRIVKVQEEKEQLTKTLRSSLEEARKEIAQLEMEIELRDQQIRSVTMTLQVERADRLQEIDRVQSIEDTLMHEKTAEGDDQREPPPEDDLTAINNDAERQELEARVEASNALVKQLNAQIRELTEEASHTATNTKKKQELEISLQKANIDLRHHEEEIKSLKETNASLELEAAANQKSMERANQGTAQMSALTTRTEQLEIELTRTRERLKVRDEKINILNSELEHHESEKLSVLDSLAEADEKIKVLECRIENERVLERKLKAAKESLADQERKALSMETEYNRAMEMKTEHEIYKEQVTSRVAFLQNQVVDLTEKQAELKTKLATADKISVSRDRYIKKLELENEESKKKVSTSKGELKMSRRNLESMGKEITKQGEANNQLESELQETKKSLNERDESIKRLEAVLVRNEELQEDLNAKIRSFSHTIEDLERERDTLRLESKSLDDQLKGALKTLDENETFVKSAELKVAEKSLEHSKVQKALQNSKQSILEMEKRISKSETKVKEAEEKAAMHEECKLVLQAKIEEANEKLATGSTVRDSLRLKLEALKLELVSDRKAADDRYQILEDQHAAACTSLAEKQTEIEQLSEELDRVEIQKDDIEIRCTDAEETVNLLEQKVRKSEDRIKSLEREVVDLSKNDIEVAFVQSEERRIEMEIKMKDAEERSDELQKNLEERESRLLELDAKVDSLENMKKDEEQRAKEATSRCTELETRIQNLDKLIESREEQLLTVGDELNQAQSKFAEKENELKKLKNLLQSLENSLAESTEISSKLKIKLEAELNVEKNKLHETRTKLDAVEAKAAKTSQAASENAATIERQEKIIDTLKKEARATVEVMDNAIKEKTAAFETEITKLETEIVLRDDEIRDLRVIELKDKEETIHTLSSALEKLKEEIDMREVDMTSNLNELKRENKGLKDEMAEMEVQATVDQESNLTKIHEMQNLIAKLETGRLQYERQLAEQDMKLRERHQVISELTKREAELLEKEQILMASCEQIAKSEASVKEEAIKLKNALDLSITRAQEDLEIQRNDLDGRRRREVGDTMSKLQSSQQKLKSTDQVLQERTKLLGEMVEHNKEMDSRLDKQESQISALEEETSRGRKELSEAQSELMRAREDLCKRENALTAKLNEERTHRDVAERSLAKLKVQYKEASRAKRLVVELEKDNAALKDKILRQQAYLERKLKKEKVQRAGRATPVNVSGATPVKSNSSLGSNHSRKLTSSPQLPRPSPQRSISSSHSGDYQLSIPRSKVSSLPSPKSNLPPTKLSQPQTNLSTHSRSSRYGRTRDFDLEVE